VDKSPRICAAQEAASTRRRDRKISDRGACAHDEVVTKIFEFRNSEFVVEAAAHDIVVR
jgi:hypothetical protein